jgi:hypothetical protein
LTRERFLITLEIEMTKITTYIISLVLAIGLLATDASAVTRKPKPTSSDKAKPADTTRLAPEAKSGPSVPAIPIAPVPADSAKGAKITPTKFNDFLDKNKNGVDDRLEKCSPEKKKPSSATTKSKSSSKTGESKKLVLPTIRKTPANKSH